MKRLARILAALLVIAVAVPAIAQVTDEDIDRARQEVNRIVADSQELGDAIQEGWARQAELGDEIAGLKSSIEFALVRLAETEQRLEEVAVELYMGSTTLASLSVLINADDDEFGAGLEYLREVSGVDDSVINQLRVFRRELDNQTSRLAEASDEQEMVTAELEEMYQPYLKKHGVMPSFNFSVQRRVATRTIAARRRSMLRCFESAARSSGAAFAAPSPTNIGRWT